MWIGKIHVLPTTNAAQKPTMDPKGRTLRFDVLPKWTAV
jgi:hypothetical protein